MTSRGGMLSGESIKRGACSSRGDGSSPSSSTSVRRIGSHVHTNSLPFHPYLEGHLLFSTVVGILSEHVRG